MSNQELKPCPFCGSKRIFMAGPVKTEVGEGYTIGCANATCRGNAFLFSPCYPSEERALEAWNRRAKDE